MPDQPEVTPVVTAALRHTVCRVNRCGRPLGIGTHMSITGYGRASDQTIPVCEDHWQALRDIFPLEVTADA